MAARLCRAEREEVAVGLARGWSYARIGDEIGRDASTVCREVGRNGGKGRYRSWVAQQRADRLAKRPRQRRLQRDPVLAGLVADGLAAMSPAPLAARLKTRGFSVCHETIYRECFAPDSVLGDAWKDLTRSRYCKKRRTRRRQRRRDPQPLGPIVLVTQRRAVLPDEPGHWEGDLIVGARNRTAAVVLAERASRIVKIGALGTQTTAEVTDVVYHLLTQVPPPMRRSLCWDQGREMAQWPHLAERLDTDVFFCHPRSPWEKPLVENTCGLLRRWLPKGTSLAVGQHRLDTIASYLNDMPRRILTWDTANQRYHHLAATTT